MHQSRYGISFEAAAAVHADGDSVVLEDLREIFAGELCSLVGVEDLRFSITIQGFLEGLITEIRVQGIGKTKESEAMREDPKKVESDAGATQKSHRMTGVASAEGAMAGGLA